MLFNDGTYASVQSWIGNAYWSGGTTQSGSGYKNTLNRRLTVHYSLARSPMIISNISYSIVSGGYDSFLAHGRAQLGTSSFGPQQIKTVENSTGPAYVKFSGLTENPFTSAPITMLVEIRAGTDSVKVFLENSQIW